ncbi:MAG: DUF4160 domain-containing protein [Candidatus Latescibacteria bacterium]|nr:DUF4160 domain-containing protein [Candidatus Latescibacterota bacterium]
MPKVFAWRGYKFFFFSNEGDPLEPCHIHIRKGGNIAKFWVVPAISLASSWGMSPKELNRLESKVNEIKSLIEERWNEHFNL